MPLVKTASVCGRAVGAIKSAPGSIAKHVSENKVPYGLMGAVGVGALGTAFYRRSKERAREDALVKDILSRNMQKQAFIMPFAKALFSGAKGLVGGVAKGAKAGMGSMAQSFENAGFKNVANGINTAVSDIGKAGNWAAQRAGQLGGWAKTTGQQMGQRFANTNLGQKAIGAAQNVKGRVGNLLKPVNAASNIVPPGGNT